ncbi:MAG TPA: hypothetical protein VFJ16_16995 [Longimicrobium sp.]|nr:hypothetical protein [Longimicrobium sp.]
MCERVVGEAWLAGRTCTSFLIRNVVTLRADGTYAQQSEARAWCDDDPPPVTSWMHYGGGRFELRGPCGDTINLFDAETGHSEQQKGVFSGNEVRLERLVFTPQRTVRYRYERVGGGV